MFLFWFQLQIRPADDTCTFRLMPMTLGRPSCDQNACLDLGRRDALPVRKLFDEQSITARSNKGTVLKAKER